MSSLVYLDYEEMENINGGIIPLLIVAGACLLATGCTLNVSIGDNACAGEGCISGSDSTSIKQNNIDVDVGLKLK